MESRRVEACCAGQVITCKRCSFSVSHLGQVLNFHCFLAHIIFPVAVSPLSHLVMNSFIPKDDSFLAVEKLFNASEE